MSFDGKTVLITGTGSGIGHAAIRHFAEAGCRVIATTESEAQLEALAGSPGVALARKLDVSQEADWERVVSEATDRLGSVDILFNNAGVTVWGDIMATDREMWDRMLLVNLTGQYLGGRAVVPGMLARGHGVIINMSSINGIRGNTNLIGYSAAKGGVIAMTRAMALDYATKGIRVNCICPGTIDTAQARTPLEIADDKEAAWAGLIAKHPMGRLGTADEIASVAVFLASDASSFITGQEIAVDGGRSIR